MAKQRKNRRFRGFGGLFLGLIIGIVLTSVIIAGIGFWAYNNMTFKDWQRFLGFEVGLGTDRVGMGEMTIDELSAFVMSYVNNFDEVTYADLERDFGIQLVPDTYYGIDLTDFKSVELVNLQDNLDLVLDQVKLSTIEQVAGFAFPNLPIFRRYTDQETETYYDEIYYAKRYDTAIEEIGNAIAAENLTLNLMKTYFAINLTSESMFVDLLDTPLGDFSTEMKAMKVGDIFNITDTNGILFAIKDFTLGYSGEGADNSLKTKINSITMAQLLNIGEGATGIMNAIKNFTIANMTDPATLNGLKIKEIVDVTGSAILSALPNDTTIANFATKISLVINGNTTLGVLCTYCGVTAPTNGWQNKTLTEVLTYLNTNPPA